MVPGEPAELARDLSDRSMSTSLVPSTTALPVGSVGQRMVAQAGNGPRTCESSASCSRKTVRRGDTAPPGAGDVCVSPGVCGRRAGPAAGHHRGAPLADSFGPFVVHGREEFAPGAGPHSALVADEEGSGEHDDQRLQARWFRELTDKLITAIEKYMEVHNHEPKPLIWTATAESILTKVRRGRVALNQAVSQ